MTKPPKRNRRKRKFKANWAHDEATAAFAAIGGVLTITNLGEHWTIRFAVGSPIAHVQWWPSTGRLMVNCRPGRTERRKTWQRLLAYVKERLAGKMYSSCRPMPDAAED